MLAPLLIVIGAAPMLILPVYPVALFGVILVVSLAPLSMLIPFGAEINPGPESASQPLEPTVMLPALRVPAATDMIASSLLRLPGVLVGRPPATLMMALSGGTAASFHATGAATPVGSVVHLVFVTT